MNSVLRSQKGISILQGLLFVALVAIASAVLLGQMNSNLKSSKISKMKTAMTSTEGKIKLAVMSSNSFTCSGDMSTCDITTTFQDLFNENLVGADCSQASPTPPFCGVMVTALDFDPATRLLTGNIVYTGSDISLANTAINIVVPEEILIASQQSCSTSAPLFQGFDSLTGNRICNSIPSGCPGADEYIGGINLQNLAPICYSAANGNTIACAADEYMSGVQWGVDTLPPHSPVLVPTCTKRIFPEVTYTPAVGTIPPVTFPPIGAPTPDTIPYVSSTTATSSTTSTTGGSSTSTTSTTSTTTPPFGFVTCTPGTCCWVGAILTDGTYATCTGGIIGGTPPPCSESNMGQIHAATGCDQLTNWDYYGECFCNKPISTLPDACATYPSSKSCTCRGSPSSVFMFGHPADPTSYEAPYQCPGL